MREGDHAGLLCTGKQFWGVGVCRQNGTTRFFIEQDGERTLLDSCGKKAVWLRVTIDSQHNRHQFSVSIDGDHFIPVGDPFALRMGYWKGSRVGLYSYNTGASQGGTVWFDFFRYDISR